MGDECFLMVSPDNREGRQHSCKDGRRTCQLGALVLQVLRELLLLLLILRQASLQGSSTAHRETHQPSHKGTQKAQGRPPETQGCDNSTAHHSMPQQQHQRLGGGSAAHLLLPLVECVAGDLPAQPLRLLVDVRLRLDLLPLEACSVWVWVGKGEGARRAGMMGRGVMGAHTTNNRGVLVTGGNCRIFESVSCQKCDKGTAKQSGGLLLSRAKAAAL